MISCMHCAKFATSAALLKCEWHWPTLLSWFGLDKSTIERTLTKTPMTLMTHDITLTALFGMRLLQIAIEAVFSVHKTCFKQQSALWVVLAYKKDWQTNIWWDRSWLTLLILLPLMSMYFRFFWSTKEQEYNSERAFFANSKTSIFCAP